jgi:hypothetical protein
MRTGLRRKAWGLALTVLGIGSMAQAQQYLPPPPSGTPEPVTRMPVVMPPAPAPYPISIRQPAAPPQTTNALPPSGPPASAVIFPGEAPKEIHEAHHEEHKAEEDCHNALLFDADFLLVRPLQRGQDFAIIGTNPNIGPVGVIKSVDGDVNTGFRVGAGYRIPGEGLEIHAVYTYIHGNDKSTIAAGTGETIFPTPTFPGIVTGVLGASAVSTVDLNMFDIEFGKRWEASEHLALRAFIGPRFGYIDQEFVANYTGGQVNSDTVRRQLAFGGVGLRAGGEATFKFWDHFGVYTRGSLSMMSGWFHSNMSEVGNGATVESVSEKFDKVIPVAEVSIGLNYQFGNLRVSGGYEIINWFGMIDGINFSDDVSPGKYNRSTGDLGFTGFVFRAELMF